jgi:hypothetical protein
VNPASSTDTFRFQLSRDLANQPGLAFPQSPGIILETLDGNLLTAAAHLSPDHAALRLARTAQIDLGSAR